jgi:hypothetical protein
MALPFPQPTEMDHSVRYGFHKNGQISNKNSFDETSKDFYPSNSQGLLLQERKEDVQSDLLSTIRIFLLIYKLGLMLEILQA